MNHSMFPSFYLAPKMGRRRSAWQLACSSSSIARKDNSCVSYFKQNMMFVVKLTWNSSRGIVVEAKATFALSLFLLAANKKAVIVSFCWDT